MPQRAMNLLLAAFGLLAVVGIILLGYDVYRHARTGPRWKRRLLGAGLMTLGLLGIVPLPGCGDGGSDTTTPVEYGQPLPTDNLADTGQWNRLMRVWTEAHAIASGQRGQYPFDEEGKRDMMATLAATGKDINVLWDAGLLSGAEAKLLLLDLMHLIGGVQKMRPTEAREVTCYLPVLSLPAKQSMNRLAKRQPLLEQLLVSERLQAIVLDKVRQQIDRDMLALSNDSIQRLDPDQIKFAKQLRTDVAQLLMQLQQRLDAPASAPSPTSVPASRPAAG